LKPSSTAEFVVPTKFKYSYVFPDSKEIAKMVKLGFPKIKLDAIENFIKNENDGIALLSLLNRILDIISGIGYPVRYVIPYRQFCTSVNTRESASLVRDAVRGMLYDLFDSIKSDDKLVEGLRTALNRDLALRMILIKKDDAEKEVNITRTKERETFKMRMRSMTDDQREITKQLLDIGIAPFIITNEDREMFAREYNYPDPEQEYEEMMKSSSGILEPLSAEEICSEQTVAHKLDLTVAELQKLFEGENRTFKDYKNKRHIISLGAKVLTALGLENRLFR
jgi:hypothetical protein